MVTSYDSESGHPGSNPEWELIYYEAPITVQGLSEPSFLRGSTLGTRAAEHKGCNWACKLTDGCSLTSCVRPHLLIYATEKSQLNCMQRLCDWVRGRSISVLYIYIRTFSRFSWLEHKLIYCLPFTISICKERKLRNIGQWTLRLILLWKIWISLSFGPIDLLFFTVF